MTSTTVTVAAILLRRRRTLLLSTAGGLFLGLLLAVLLPRAWAATSRFKPQNGDQNTQRLAGLAAQFGVAVGGFGSDGESPEFYAELLRSEALLRQAALSTYRVPRTEGAADTLSGTLVQLLQVEGDDEEERVRNTVDELRDRVHASVGPTSGMVLVRVEMPVAGLAEAVNRRLLDLTSAFNLETRQSRAAAERAFVEQRMKEMETELAQAESAHRRFLEQNRRYSESPELRFEEARLGRRVSLQQEVYTSLAQAYERARIDEVRNTPVITVVDPPEHSVRPAGAGPAFRVAAGLLIGLMIGIFAVFLQEYVARLRAASPGRFDELRADAGKGAGVVLTSRAFHPAPE